MAFDLTKPSMTDGNWAASLGYIRENFRAIVQGDAGVFSQMWITAEPAYVVFEKSGQTAKARVIGVSDGAGNELLWLAANASTVVAGSSWNRDDTGKVAWLCGLETVSDTFKIYRSAAGANPISWSTLFTLNSAGDLIPGRNVGLTDNCTLAWGVGSSAISGSSAAGSLSLSISSAEQARITATGLRIGGATSPAARLHVGAGGTGNNSEQIFVDSGSAAGGFPSLILKRNATQKAVFGVSSQAGDWIGGSAANDLCIVSTQAINFSADNGTLHSQWMPGLGGATGFVMFFANLSVAPTSNPTGGGYLYVQGGALKWRGSSGTVTTIAAA